MDTSPHLCSLLSCLSQWLGVMFYGFPSNASIYKMSLIHMRWINKLISGELLRLVRVGNTDIFEYGRCLDRWRPHLSFGLEPWRLISLLLDTAWYYPSPKRFPFRMSLVPIFPSSLSLLLFQGSINLESYNQIFFPVFCVNHLLVHIMPSSHKTVCPP